MNLDKLHSILFLESPDEDIFQESIEQLHDLVIDTAMENAAKINNSGPYNQLKYLMDNGWTPEAIYRIMELECIQNNNI